MAKIGLVTLRDFSKRPITYGAICPSVSGGRYWIMYPPVIIQKVLQTGLRSGEKLASAQANRYLRTQQIFTAYFVSTPEQDFTVKGQEYPQKLPIHGKPSTTG